MKRYLVVIAAIGWVTASAQTVVIKKVELVREKVNVYFDLEGSNSNQEFSINLYASRDNFSVPLSRVKGDVGQEIKGGTNKKIEWSLVEEYGPYKGTLALEIRGKVYTPFVKLEHFDTKMTYKRGKSYTLDLKPSNTNPMHVELYKGSERVSAEMNHPSTNAYVLNIPSHAKSGSDYRVKITDSRNGEEIIYSPVFRVKPKLPLLIKVIPLVVVGIAAAVFSGGAKKDPGRATAADIALPPFPSN